MTVPIEWKSFSIHIAPSSLIVKKDDLPVAYCLFTPLGEIDYIYVRGAYRRLGIASRLIEEVRQMTGRQIKPMEPVSPLGQAFFKGEGVL